MAGVGDLAELAIRVKFDDVGRATVALEGMTTAGRKAEAATDGLAGATNRHGAATVAGTRGMGVWAALQAESAGHVGNHSLAIGRLERALAGIVGHFVGANAAVELLGSGLLKFALGSVETVGLLGGLALMAVAYEKLTGEAKKAREEADKLIESLAKAIQLKGYGPGGSTVGEVEAANGRINALAAERYRLNQGLLESPRPGASPMAAQSLVHAQEIARAKIEDITNEMQDLRNLTAGGKSIVKEKVDDALAAEREKELARLRAIATEEKRKEALLKAYNEMMEKAYGGVLGIQGMTGAQRADWLASQHGRTMTDAESAGVRKLLGPGGDLGSFDAYGNWTGKGVSMPNVGLNDSLSAGGIKQRKKMGIDLSGGEDQGGGLFGGVAGALSQFAPQAIVTSLVTTGINFIASGFTDLASNMLSGGQAAREAALAMKTMKDNFLAAVAAFKHDDFAAALAQNQVAYDQLLKQLRDTTSVYDIITKGTGAYNASAADLAAQKVENDAIIKRQAGYAQEDLAVRGMRATGQGDAADLLAFREKQQREMQAAIDSHKDALYLNTLTTVQNSELLAYQNGLLSDALRNSPTGFYGIAGYAGDYATPRGPAYPTDPGVTVPTNPHVPNGRSSAPTTLQLVVDGRVIAQAVARSVDQFGASTSGAGSSRSAAFDRMPLS